MVAGWRYLQQPEAVAAELLRVVRPHGQLIVAFSNRSFSSRHHRYGPTLETVTTCSPSAQS